MPEKTKIFLNQTRFFSAPTASVDEFSPRELAKALAFHRSMPAYVPTPLLSLNRLASALGKH